MNIYFDISKQGTIHRFTIFAMNGKMWTKKASLFKRLSLENHTSIYFILYQELLQPSWKTLSKFWACKIKTSPLKQILNLLLIFHWKFWSPFCTSTFWQHTINILIESNWTLCNTTMYFCPLVTTKLKGSNAWGKVDEICYNC